MNELDVRFDARAAADVRTAIAWYDAERDGLGDEFLSAMDQVVRNIARYPRMYPLVADDVRRALTPQFPFAVFYNVGEAVEIVAVLHTSRRPEMW